MPNNFNETNQRKSARVSVSKRTITIKEQNNNSSNDSYFLRFAPILAHYRINKMEEKWLLVGFTKKEIREKQ